MRNACYNGPQMEIDQLYKSASRSYPGAHFTKIFIAHYSNSKENLFYCNTIHEYEITTNFCTCHDSTTVVAWAQSCSDHLIITWMRPKEIYIGFQLGYKNHLWMGSWWTKPLSRLRMLLAGSVQFRSSSGPLWQLDTNRIPYLISPWTKWPPFWQMTFSNEFSGMKMVEFWFKFHWNLFPRVQLTITHHWFR